MVAQRIHGADFRLHARSLHLRHVQPYPAVSMIMSFSRICHHIAVLLLLTAMASADAKSDLLIDDFSSRDGKSALGTEWRGFTDRVMGGLSDMQVGYHADEQEPVLRMTGQVRLDNNGGFIQARVPLSASGRLDASGFEGFRVRVRGQAGPYYLHLRSRHTWRPWQYYRAPVEIGPEWRDLFVPFSAFEARSVRRGLDITSLESLGIVAYGEAFDAEIEVARIELVP